MIFGKKSDVKNHLSSKHSKYPLFLHEKTEEQPPGNVPNSQQMRDAKPTITLSATEKNEPGFGVF